MATLRLVPASGTPVEITKDLVVVGRDPSCDIVLSDGSVSRKHAHIEKRGLVWAVVDQASANGTFLDSQRVADARLRTGQDLRFGAVSFRLEIVGEIIDTGATLMPTSLEAGATVMQPLPLGIPPAPARPGSTPLPPRVSAPPPRIAAPPPPPRVSAPPLPPPTGDIAPLLQGSPVPPMAGAAPAPKKGKGPVFWIATGCCGCLLVVVLVAGGIFGAAWWATKGVADAVQSELAVLRQGHIELAYAELSESWRREMDLQDFTQLVESHPALRENSDATFPVRNVSNQTATVSGFLTSAAGQREAVSFRLVKEAGAWKIAGITFGPSSP
jgi:predicted component of type VI protein secretion system